MSRGFSVKFIQKPDEDERGKSPIRARAVIRLTSHRRRRLQKWQVC